MTGMEEVTSPFPQLWPYHCLEALSWLPGRKITILRVGKKAREWHTLKP